MHHLHIAFDQGTIKEVLIEDPDKPVPSEKNQSWLAKKYAVESLPIDFQSMNTPKEMKIVFERLVAEPHGRTFLECFAQMMCQIGIDKILNSYQPPTSSKILEQNVIGIFDFLGEGSRPS